MKTHISTDLFIPAAYGKLMESFYNVIVTRKPMNLSD